MEETIPRWRAITGWIAVSISTAALVFWSYWGSIETFYEGWYHRSLWQNLALTFAQYLLPVFVLAVPAMLGVLRPRLGGLLHLALAVAIFIKINTPAGRIFIFIPLLALSTLYWFGSIQRKKLALCLLFVIPLLTMLVCGAYPAYLVTQRIDDGIRTSRIIEGNGVRLRWAAAGPGWPSTGGSWFTAQSSCAFLSADSTHLESTPQNIWRLPSAEELTRSLSLHGKNSGGTWDASTGTPNYQLMPDKESPLWDRYSMIIYWWTSTESSPQHAYRFSYNGRAMPTAKSAAAGYYGFRCVTAAENK